METATGKFLAKVEHAKGIMSLGNPRRFREILGELVNEFGVLEKEPSSYGWLLAG